MPVFVLSIALSATLLFLVQPIIARQVLPWFGGSAGVWTICMVFFQVTLLAGYAYAHALNRWLAPRRQWLLHTTLLAISAAFLPIVVGERFRPDASSDESIAILVLLAATIGLPYFLLASTGPLMQSWWVRQWPGKPVYRLFALSNAGSLAGLVAYPFLIEPFLGVRTQALIWSAAFGAFALLCAAAAWRMARSVSDAASPGAADAKTPEPAPATSPEGATGRAQAEHRSANPGSPVAWIGFSALGVMMVLGATAHLSQNVASVPFLWIVPLSLYLLSFVLAFDGRSGRGWYAPGWGIPLCLGAVMLMALGLSVSDGLLDMTLSLPLYCAGVLVTCLFCHGELALRRPDAADLTRFYLMISLGGALGGIFSGLVAPRIFQSIYEFPLALFGVAASAVVAGWQQTSFGHLRKWVTALAVTALFATGFWDYQFVQLLNDHAILLSRSFYGTLSVQKFGKGTDERRILRHGVVVHGLQYTYGPGRLEPTEYYRRESGIGLAIASAQSRRADLRLGVIGLGVGTLSTYGRKGDTVRFYEIDPAVVAIAQREFAYLSSTPADVQIVVGDARRSLQLEVDAGRAPRFDVLAVDAFSGDSVPVHLLTRQAMELYLQCLAEDGVLALHVSNRFLDLKPGLANMARQMNLHATLVAEHPRDHPETTLTEWVLISKNAAALAAAPLQGHTETLVADPRLDVWTDDFSNLLETVKARPLAALRQLWAQ